MASPPYMKLYWNDLIASCADMSGPEFGAHVRLLAYQWQHGHLPPTDDIRRRVCGYEKDEWQVIWNGIRHRFSAETDVGFLGFENHTKFVHPRLEKERKSAIEMYERKARIAKNNGKKGGRPPKKEETDIGFGAETNSSSSSSSRSNKKRLSPKKGYSDEFETFWSHYPTVRRTKKPDAWKAWQELDGGDRIDALAAVIDFSRSPAGRSEFCPGPGPWLRARRWEDDRASWKSTAAASGTRETDPEEYQRQKDRRIAATREMLARSGADAKLRKV